MLCLGGSCCSTPVLPFQQIRHIPLHPHRPRTSQLSLVVSLADVISVTELSFVLKVKCAVDLSEGGGTPLVLQLLVTQRFCF